MEQVEFKPMLATTLEDLESVILPAWASAKLDGYRAICREGSVVSRNLKPVRNLHVRDSVEGFMDVLEGFDGELCLADLTAKFNDVSSAISRGDGTPDFRYVIFDYHADPESDYKTRFIDRAATTKFPSFVVVVPMKLCNTIEEILQCHAEWTAMGFEGTMVRRADGEDRYKHNRSTNREMYLCKIKDFADTEATVISFEERYSNQNEATKNLLGHTERSHHLAGMVPTDTLGALVVKCLEFDEPFAIGTGFDDALRKEIWMNQDKYLGKTLTFRHQPSGAKIGGKPRFPSFSGFRCEDDLS